MDKKLNELKRGEYINYDGHICQVLKTDFNYRGRGSATVKVRFKNLSSSAVMDFTGKSDMSVSIPEIESIQMQFLYKEGNSLVFMDPRTFDQTTVPSSLAKEFANFLNESALVYVIKNRDTTIALRPPQSIRLKVVEAFDAAKGDTATSPKKSVVLETGAEVKVPLFINQGDYVVVNPETGEYVERG